MDKVLKVTCDVKLMLPVSELNGIQGALKMMTQENFAKLRKRMVANGIKYPIHVWKQLSKSKGKKVTKWWIVDGHGRKAMVDHLVGEEGFKLKGGLVPCVEIFADSFEDAKKEVLAASSQYHTMTDEGLYEFMSSTGLKMEDIEEFVLPEIDMPSFEMKHFGSPEEEAEEQGEKKNVSFDAYQNSSVKQVVLYFAKEDYEKILKALDAVMEKYDLEDYSQAVWRLANEYLPA